MSVEFVHIKIEISEDDIIHAKVRLARIKAIANTLTTLERNGYTDELFKGTIGGLMGTIEAQVEEANRFLKY